MPDDIEKLKVIIRRLDELREEAKALKESMAALKLRLAKEMLGLEVGSVIAVNGMPEVFRVSQIDLTHWHPESDSYQKRPYLEGFPKRNDGTWSRYARVIYDEWKVVEGRGS